MYVLAQEVPSSVRCRILIDREGVRTAGLEEGSQQAETNENAGPGGQPKGKR